MTFTNFEFDEETLKAAHSKAEALYGERDLIECDEELNTYDCIVNDFLDGVLYQKDKTHANIMDLEKLLEQEQRLNAMGQERELRLLSTITEKDKTIRQLQEDLKQVKDNMEVWASVAKEWEQSYDQLKDKYELMTVSIGDPIE